eukprot:m.274950 g.274950  ORF g.274950 m.274950 type:complete len:445 (+) comp16291_c0_seq4:191-1525(+)
MYRFTIAIAVLLVVDSVTSQCVTTTPLPVDPTVHTNLVAALDTRLTDSIVGGIGRGDLIGGVVRLAFHDASGFNRNDASNPGGPDGCFDTNNPDNNGLDGIAGRIEDIYTAFCSSVSKADFWALAAKVSVDIASSSNVKIPFRYGRTTRKNCIDSSNGRSRLPGAEQGLPEINRIMVSNWGMSLERAVALLGAHTLGRAERQFSGYQGPWVAQPDVFNNNYYRDIIFRPWVRRGTNTHTEWRRGPRPELMLNADMELGYSVANCNFDATDPINAPRRPGRCNPHNIADANLPLMYTNRFATNQNLWFRVFEDAMEEMTELGTQGQLLCQPNIGDCTVRNTDLVVTTPTAPAAASTTASPPPPPPPSTTASPPPPPPPSTTANPPPPPTTTANPPPPPPPTTANPPPPPPPTANPPPPPPPPGGMGGPGMGGMGGMGGGMGGPGP